MSVGYSFVSAPSIKERLVAALEDDYPMHVVHYNRREGATTAIIELIKGNVMKEKEHIRAYCTEGQLHFYREAGINARLYTELESHKHIGLQGIQAIILDVVPDNSIQRCQRDISSMGIKLIAVKPIRKALSTGPSGVSK